MSERPFFILDVFAEKLHAGNQLAVICEAAGLTTEQMQAIALEMNYSETTFVTSPIAAEAGGDAGGGRDGGSPRDAGTGPEDDTDETADTAAGYDVRIFTPREELPFAGHPTLGTAYLLRQLIGEGAPEPIVLRLGVGPVAVTFDAGDEARGWLHPSPPELLGTVPAEIAADLLGLNSNDIDPEFPVQNVSAGIEFLLVPLSGRDAVSRASLDGSRWQRYLDGASATGVFFFSRDTFEPDHDIGARMLFDAGGIREDPATGSANACFAAYLAQHRYLGSAEVDAKVEQGYEMRRPSLLSLRARIDGGVLGVSVGGRTFVSARGQLSV